MMPLSEATWVDTLSAVEAFLADIDNLPRSPPSLYVDIEGINLCRHGKVSIIQVHIANTGHTYLLDALTLGHNLFTVWSITLGTTFKDILEDPRVPKVFFDCRNDSDALYAQYGISLQGVQDIQLMEVATRRFNRNHVNQLAECVDRDLHLNFAEFGRLRTTQQKMPKRMFRPLLGEEFAIFTQRPLPQKILQYCMTDADILPRLWISYRERLSDVAFVAVLRQSAWRVELTKSPDYDARGAGHADSGWPWQIHGPGNWKPPAHGVDVVHGRDVSAVRRCVRWSDDILKNGMFEINLGESSSDLALA